MNTSRINRAARLVAHLRSTRALQASPFCLVDVGASGGIEDYWRQFLPDLQVFAFDPMVEECQRLNAAERNTSIRYFDYLLGSDDYEQVFPLGERSKWSDFCFPRTSAGATQEKLKLSYAQMVNVQARQTMSGKRTSLDRFFDEHGDQTVDFVKVDTDGHDYEVLRGSLGMLGSRQVLGLLVEVPFQGISHPHSQLFGNIDRLLRENGFTLFDMETYRYSRSALPDAFLYDLPAQTRHGQLIAGDVLYFRDVCAPGYSQEWRITFDAAKLLKLACLLELFGMPDCAAEVMVTYREKLSRAVDVPRALDFLAADLHGEGARYEEIRERFTKDPESFFGGRMRAIAPRATTYASAESLAAELEGMRASRSWRLTAPLRGLGGLARRLLTR